ncbi:MAG TPA: YdeI/OmpD-associated family protein [Vicinamibacterales bacterium]|nr:YdeI/OmpD-associated family protein [Vicinamibacterales bacterium]
MRGSTSTSRRLRRSRSRFSSRSANFSPSHRREYIEWVTEAKMDATRAKRLQQAVEWLAEGKPRNWKYM